MKLTANIIGATGLVGSHLVSQLLENEHFANVRIFVRKKSPMQHPKLEQHVTDFKDEATWGNHLKGDMLFSALGTTRKQAGGKEKQYEVDFTWNLRFAQKAKENGIENYILVSSIGASASSPFFYARMKGELDEAVNQAGFRNLAILRPSSLTGDRREKRWLEELSIPVVKAITQLLFKKYRPVHGKMVAKAMIKAALNPDTQKTIWEGDEIFQLADSHSS